MTVRVLQGQVQRRSPGRRKTASVTYQRRYMAQLKSCGTQDTNYGCDRWNVPVSTTGQPALRNHAGRTELGHLVPAVIQLPVHLVSLRAAILHIMVLFSW